MKAVGVGYFDPQLLRCSAYFALAAERRFLDVKLVLSTAFGPKDVGRTHFASAAVLDGDLVAVAHEVTWEDGLALLDHLKVLMADGRTQPFFGPETFILPEPPVALVRSIGEMLGALPQAELLAREGRYEYEF